MKRKNNVLILLLLFSLLLITLIITASCSRFKKQKRFIAATSPTLPPMEMIGKNNKISGFDIELINTIAEKENFTVDIIPVIKENLLYGIIDKTYDMVVSGIYLTPELKSKFSGIVFSMPYLEIGEIVVVPEDINNINSIYDLKGKTLGIQSGSPALSRIKNIKDIDVKEYRNIKNAFDDLARGKIDALSADLPIASQNVYYNDEYRGIFKITRVVLSNKRYVIAIAKDNQELLKKINNAIRTLKREGILDKMIEKWFFSTQGKDY